MLKRYSLLAITGVMVVLLCAIAMPSVQANDEGDLEGLPEAVQKSIKEFVKDGTINEIELETENGEIYYEAELEMDGEDIEILLTSGGDIIQTDKELTADAIPTAITDRITEQFADAKIEGAALVQVTYYEVEVEIAFGETELLYFADGSMVDRDDDDDD